MSSSLRRVFRSLLLLGLPLCAPATQAGVSSVWKFDSTPLVYPDGAIEGDGFTGNTQNRFIGAGAYYGRTNAFVRGTVGGPDRTKPWAVSAWFRSDADTGLTDTLFSWWSTGNAECIFRSNASSRFSLDVGDKSYIWRTPGTLLDQKWHHVTLTSATGSAPYRLFIDGAEALSPQTGSVTAGAFNEDYFIIGGAGDHYAAPARNWDGWIDDIGILNEAATPESDAAIYAFGKLGIGLADYPSIGSLLASAPGTPIYLRGVLWEKTVGGLSGSAGSGGGTLAGGDAYVVTGANGAGLKMSPPLATGVDLTFGPGSFSGSLGFGQKVTLPAKVSNSSTTGSLQWQITGAAGQLSSLEGYAHQLNANIDAILAPLTYRVPLSTSLNNGPYSGDGNNLSVYGMNSYNLLRLPVYNDPVVRAAKTTDYQPDGPLQGQVRYTCLFRPDFSALTSDLTNIRSLTVTGNAASLPAVSSSESVTVRGVSWKAWYYTVPGYRQQNIQHIFLTPADPAITFTAATTGESATLENLPAACRVHHLWFTTSADSTLAAGALQSFARSFLELTHAPAGFILPDPASGTLPPGGSADVTVTLDSTGFPAGAYDSALVVSARGADADAAGAIRRPVHLDIAAPQFTAAEPPKPFSFTANEIRHTDKILLTAAEGFTLGQVTASTDSAWVRAVPSENRTGEVDLYIDTTGMTPGAYVANITISAGSTTRTVKITIQVAESQVFRMVADPVRPRLYTLESSYTSDQSSYTQLLVLDSTTGKQVRQIRAQGVGDLAMSPDGARLYTVSNSPARIGWFDLERMIRATPLIPAATFAPNESIAQLVPGPGNALYLLSAGDRRLVVQNAETGALIQTLANPGQDLLFGRICLSADGKSLLANVNAVANYSGPATTQIARFDIQPDGSLAAAEPREAPVVITPPLPATVLYDIASLSVTQDGRYTVSGDRAYEAERPATSSTSFPSTLWCMSPGGEFAVGSSAIYSGDGQHFLYDLSQTGLAAARSVAVTPEGRIFLTNDAGVRSFDVRAALGDAKAGYFIAPGDGAGVNIPATFRWLPVEGAREYRVYASRDEAALQADAPAAGTEIAHTSFYRIANPVAALMTGGETWYWRVDAAAPQGRVRGEVHRFTLNTLSTDRDHLDITTIRGCTSQPAQLRLLPGPDGAPAPWTASSDQPWLKLETTSGDGAQPVRMTINATLLANDSGTATLTLQSGAATVRIPVSAQALYGAPVDLETATDYDTAFAIVMTAEAGNFSTCRLLRIDPVTGTPLESRPVDTAARYLRFSPDQSTVAVETNLVSTLGTNSLEIFDTASLEKQGKLVSYASYSSSTPVSVTALGPAGKAIYANRLVHYPDNRILATRPGIRGSDSPISAFSADGKYLYGPVFRGLVKLDATSPTLATLKSASIDAASYVAGGILTSKDPGHLVYGNLAFDTDLNVTAINLNGGLPIQAINRSGTLGISATGMVHLPGMKQIPAFAAGQLYLPAFDDRHANILSITGSGPADLAYRVTSYRNLLTIDQSTLKPGVPDGALIASDLTLSWSDVPSAGAYRVFVSTSLSEIEAAEPGDPSELGISYGTSWKLTSPLQANTVYYWKLILEGPAGHVSSAAWSFHTSNFTLSESALTMVGPLGCAPMTRQIDLAVPAGRSWSVTTGTPWLQVGGGGTGSGKITFTVDPAGFGDGTYTGSATVTVGGEYITVPVTFKSFKYHMERQIVDPDRSYVHLLVFPELDVKTTEPGYLVKIDMNTHQAVDAVDLGEQFLTYTGDFYLSVHPEDDRVYFYNGTTQKIYGCNRSTYRLEKTLPVAGMSGFASNGWNGKIYSAGPGRMAVFFQGIGIKIYSTDTGALISERNFSAAENYFSLLSGPGGTRLYAFGQTPTGEYDFPASYDISNTGVISDGPRATRKGSEYYNVNPGLGLTSGGRTVYFLNTLYDLDLNATGELFPADSLYLISGDGSVVSMASNPGTFRYLISADGLTRYARSPDLSSTFSTAVDPLSNRFGTFGYPLTTWVEFLKPSAAVPDIPRAGWFTFGTSTWHPDPSQPGVLTVSGLRTPATLQSGASSTLSVTPFMAGKLVFEWRTLTSGGERQELRLNGTAQATRRNDTVWEHMEIEVGADTTVEWTYLIDNVASADSRSRAELRNITFTPASGGATVSAGISPMADSDGDGFTDLLEAALGTDPASAASRPVAGLVMNGSAVSFVYERPASSTYQYTVQVSQDLVTWQDLPAEGASVTAAAAASPGGAARQRVTMPLSATGSKNFTRLKVADAGAK